MGRFTRIEDIKAWVEARRFAADVYKMTMDGQWGRDYGLRDQIRKASVSIACNIAEGYARDTNTEFRRFLAIARGSAMEAKTQLYIALDIGYLTKDEFDGYYKRIDEICRMTTGLMDYLEAHSRK